MPLEDQIKELYLKKWLIVNGERKAGEIANYVSADKNILCTRIGRKFYFVINDFCKDNQEEIQSLIEKDSKLTEIASDVKMDIGAVECIVALIDGSKLKSGKESDDKVKEIATPTIITEEFIAEEIWDRQNPPRYAVYRFDTKEIEYIDRIESDEEDNRGKPIVYVPLDNEALRKGIVILPEKSEAGTWKEVFEKADALVAKYYDANGKEALVRFLVRVTSTSWLLDKYVPKGLDIGGMGRFAPIIPIRGASGSGKNRLANILRLLAYRPYFVMSTYRIPSLYRPIDTWRGTLVMDEADFSNTGEKSELIHFLNCRATGTQISRQDTENPKLTQAFQSFGITILTQRRVFDDNATESRAIPFYSEQTTRQLPTVEPDEMIREGLDLQNRLLYLRLTHYRDFAIDKTARLDINDQRLIASVLPLLALGYIEPSILELILANIKEVERLKVEQKATSEDGIMVNLLFERVNEGFASLYNGKYYITGEDKAPLTASKIAESLNWSSKEIRKVIKSLNLIDNAPDRIKIDKKTYRPVFFETDRLEKRCRDFVIAYEQNSILKVLGLVKDSQTSIIDSLGDTLQGTPRPESVTSGTSVTKSLAKGDTSDAWDTYMPLDTCNFMCSYCNKEAVVKPFAEHFVCKECYSSLKHA